MSKVEFVSTEKSDDVRLKRIGEIIRRARGDQSQAEFASRVGISRSALSAYENGTRRAEDYTLAKIAAVAPFTMEDLQRGYSESDVAKIIEAHPRFRITQVDDAFVLMLNLMSIDEKFELLKLIEESIAFSALDEVDRLVVSDSIRSAVELIDEIQDRRDVARVALSKRQEGPQ